MNDEDITFEEENEEKSTFKRKGVDDLKKKLKKCEEEKREYLDGWQRARADFANAKKKHEENKQGFIQTGREDVLEKIFPVIDSFDMAFQGEAWEKVDSNWRQGILYIHSQLLSALESFDLEVLDPKGEKFDPNIHTSVESIETDNKEEDEKIAGVVQKGFKMGDKIVRSPKVKVFNYTEDK